MAKVISIGNQSFESIREKDNFYIDKTNFIREWWDNDDTVTLITRPRRFGKTLNMSMLNCFSQISMRTEEIYLRNLRYGKMRNIVRYREHIQ